MTATPTEAERETAMRVMAWDPLTYPELVKSVRDGGDPDDGEALAIVDAIAQALADQRVRYEAVADELDARSVGMSSASLARAEAAARIRSVAR